MTTPPIDSRATTVAGNGGNGDGRMFTPGQILGDRYRVELYLGRGGMGEVWRAHDLKLRVDVALKSVLKEGIDARALEQLRQEVRTGREVVSPNVCRIFDLAEVDGRELISMEYIDGLTLIDLLRARAPLPPSETAGITAQFLAGLDAIHSAGLVHRDVKPENIMITRSGRVVLMDFGLALSKSEGESGTVSGTRGYMSPEQRQGGALDPRSDYYSAGVVLAEMTNPAGLKDRESRTSIQDAVREDPSRLPETPWLPVVRKAVAKEPGERFDSAQAMTRDVKVVALRITKAVDRNPYPGLASFNEEDAEYFYGREIEVESIWTKLKQPHLMALIGPSGAGKSSFLRAGVIPARPDDWRILITTPGNDPFAAVAELLAAEFAGDPEAVRQLVRFSDGDTAVSLVRGWRGDHAGAVIIIDQFEELFTLNSPEAQGKFAGILARLALEADVHVLLSMRDDFLIYCQSQQALGPIFSELTPLMAPGGANLRRALEQPALLCGYRFEDDSLIEEMLQSVEGERGALPLLAFAVSQLWEKRDQENGLLTRKAYEEIGGVGGALARHAEATLERIGADGEPIVREMFRNLVTAQGTRAVRHRDELLSVFPQRERVEQVLQHLIDARLLTSFEVQDGTAQQVEIIHESLLKAWPRLVRWQAEDADGALLRDQLRQAARTWEERGHLNDLLWSGRPYRQFQLWREMYPGGLSAREEAFCRAMVFQAGRRRRRMRLAMSAAFALLLGVIGFIGWSWNRAEEALLESEARQIFTLGQRDLHRDPTGSMAYAIASLKRVDRPEVRRFALDAVQQGPTCFGLWQSGIPGSAYIAVDFSADGRWAAIGHWGGQISLLDGRGGAPKILQTPEAPVQWVRFGPGSDLVLSGHWHDASVRLWSIPEGELIRTMKFGAGEDLHMPLHISADRTRLLTATFEFTVWQATRVRFLSWPPAEDQPVVLGELKDVGVVLDVDAAGKQVAYSRKGEIYIKPIEGSEESTARLVGRQANVRWLTFSSDAGLLATGDTAGGIRVWSLEAESQESRHAFDVPESVSFLRFDPAGTRLASGHAGGMVRIWDLAAPRGTPPLELSGIYDDVFSLAFHPEGHWLVSANRTSGVALWRFGKAYPRVLHRKSSGDIYTRGLAFGPEGKWLSVTMGDPIVRRFPLTRLAGEPTEIPLTDEIFDTFSASGLAADPTGRYLLAGTESGAILVPLQGGAPRRLPGFVDIVRPVAFSPDGKLAAAAGGFAGQRVDEEFIRVWDLDTGATRDLKESPGTIEFASNDRLLFEGDGGSLHRWNLEEDSVEPFEAINQGEFGSLVLRGLSPGGRFALTHSDDGLFVHDLEEGGNRRLLWVQCATAAINRAGDIIVCGAPNGLIHVYPASGGPPHLLVGHELLDANQGPITEVAIAPDGRTIASIGQDGTLRLWPMPEGEPPMHLPIEQFIDRLESLTNFRLVPMRDRSTGYGFEHDPPLPLWVTDTDEAMRP